MIVALRCLFSLIFVTMVAVTVYASWESSVVDGGARLLADRWGVATLFDAYFAFITFSIWMFYKERSAVARGLWFIAILALGNIAISFYLLRQLFRLPADASIERLLLREERAG
jgi:hypothetical protein